MSSSDADAATPLWAEIAARDASCLAAHAFRASAAATSAIEAHDAGDAEQARALGLSAKALLDLAMKHLQYSSPRWESVFTPAYKTRARAFLEFLTALMFDFCSDEADESGLASAVHACMHYELATKLDGTERRVWQLWAACAGRDASLPDDVARRAAARAVHAEAVRRGLWLRAEQRPLQLVPELAADATPWLDATSSPVCVALAKNFAKIRQEALQLVDSAFQHSRSDASVRGLAELTRGGLTAGQTADWRDVSLFVNGRRHEQNAKLAPFTSALLASDEGSLLRDSTSCVYGSAFFSLLAPGTRLRPHCGPTNVRLRAHLPLIVPKGDLKMRVGNATPRRWKEGKVALFDDSFEHEVWNESEEARLVLIVDLWHPKLDSDEKRRATLDAARAERYDKIVRDRAFESAEAAEAAKLAAGASAGKDASRLLGVAEAGCTLQPLTFFVAWNGVLTMVFTGFPPPLARLKSRLNEKADDFGLTREGFGSKWPKATLGALVPHGGMTRQELKQLKQLCVEFGCKLRGKVVIEHLSVVKYSARGLEARWGRELRHVPLRRPFDEEAPSDEEDERVRKVLSEWDDLDEYLPRVNAPGSRIDTYREASPSGSTVVAFLRPGAWCHRGLVPGPIIECIRELQAEVDRLMPGRYEWLADESLHCTVRALDGGQAK